MKLQSFASPLCLMMVGFASSAAGQTETLFSQASPFPSHASVWRSNFTTGPSPLVITNQTVQGARVYDDFRVDRDATIGRVRWQMAIGDDAVPANNPPADFTVNSWEITLWAEQSGEQPGNQILSAVIAPGDVTHSLVGIIDDPGYVANNWAVYDFEGDLPAPFSVSQDTTYWLSIVANTPAWNPSFGWTGDSSNGASIQDALNSGHSLIQRFNREADFAFTLEEMTRPAGFAAWIAGFELTGGNAAADADPDSDSLESGVEYVLGGDPKVSSTVSQPTAALDGDTLVFTFHRTDTSETPDVTVAVRTSSDLATWPTVYTVGQDTASSSPGVSILENGDAPDAITVTIPRGTAPLMFARLVVAVRP